MPATRLANLCLGIAVSPLRVSTQAGTVLIEGTVEGSLSYPRVHVQRQGGRANPAGQAPSAAGLGLPGLERRCRH